MKQGLSYSHFTNEETGEQTSKVTCSRSVFELGQSEYVTILNQNLKTFKFTLEP